jgi:monoamine oxidase
VGAGFAGLSAARDLVRLGHDVVVSKAAIASGDARRRRRSRTHRSISAERSSGRRRTPVIALAKELGCETVRTHSRGKNLIRWRGQVRSYRSTIPQLSIIELLDVSRIQWRFERVCRRVPVKTVDVADRRHP